MHHRRFSKLIHVADPDEPESGPEPASEAGPASPSSGEDTKTEAPSPKKRFLFIFSILFCFYVNWEVKRWRGSCMFMKPYVGGRWRRGWWRYRSVTWMDLRAKEKIIHRRIHGPGGSTAKSPSKAPLTQGNNYNIYTFIYLNYFP